jgi:hypothetical protein
MAVKIIAIIAALNLALLFIKNIPLKTSILFFLDLSAGIALYFTGMPYGQVIVFISLALVLNVFIAIASGNKTNAAKKNRFAIPYAAAAAGTAAITAFFLRPSDNTPLKVSNLFLNAEPVFFIFCAVFTAAYFIMKEEEQVRIDE